MGGRSETRSPGWAGEKIVFPGEGYMGADKTGMRDTFVKNPDGSMGHVGEMQANGQWMKVMEETCNRN